MTSLTHTNSVPATSTTAATLYAALRDQARNSVKRQNLERIWNALEALRAEAGKRKRPGHYTPAAVMRWLEEAGTPIGESTIRNPGQGDDYRALIKTYQAQYAEQPSSVEDDDLSLSISDQRLAARVRVLQRQNRALKERNDILHTQYQRLVSEGAPPALPAPVTAAPRPPVSSRETTAVRQFLERAHLHCWSIDEATGAILDHREDEIAPPGFVQALRRIIES